MLENATARDVPSGRVIADRSPRLDRAPSLGSHRTFAARRTKAREAARPHLLLSVRCVDREKHSGQLKKPWYDMWYVYDLLVRIALETDVYLRY